MVQRLKALKQGKQLGVQQVWDDEEECYVSEVGEIANVFLREVRDRQGAQRGDATSGRGLLERWQADFSRCRTGLTLNEIEIIMRDGPRGKRPGPSGVPGELFRRYAAQMAVVFQEAWAELMNEDFTDDMYRTLALKTWIVVPKFEGANRVEKFRDLELGEEARKILARMMNKVLDEVCSHAVRGLCKSQQAFVSGRDIVRNTSGMLRMFWEAVEERGRDDDPLMMLLLDCTKGYNLLSREWVVRVLSQAQLPSVLIAAVEKMMVNDSVLLINGLEQGSFRTNSGLIQGCPLSCFFFVHHRHRSSSPST